MNRDQKIKVFRERFKGRSDVYGKEWKTKEGARGFSPVCQNFWSDVCHIKLKDGVPCHKCEHQKYDPVTDATVWKHISGEEAQIAYLLQLDGRLWFGALDFDLKEGKEHLGHTFEDVQACMRQLAAWGLPCAAANSSGNGKHLYFFFSEPVPANEFRAIMYELFERVGFMDQLRQGHRGIPEVYPKQSAFGINGLGNAIKPPMIESRWSIQRNGFLNDDGVFLPPEMQWRYLDSVERISHQQLKDLILKEGILVHELPFEEKSGPLGPGTYSSLRPTGKWQPPLNGSVEKVLEGCAAFRKIRDKCAAGQQPRHDEGMALFHMAMGTADGVAWFAKNVPGWAQNEKDWAQLGYSMSKNYTPNTCKKMQEVGICSPGTKCFDRRPPLVEVEGQLVRKTDVPEAEWPEPSPVRYAHGRGEDFLKKLQEEAQALKEVEDEQQRVEQLAALCIRAQVFDEEQQKEFKAALIKMKVVKTKDVHKAWNDAVAAHQEAISKNVEQCEDTVTVNSIKYRKMRPFGYRRIKKVKGGKTPEEVICATDIEIQEVRTYQEEDRVATTVFRGKARGDGIEKTFEIETTKWVDDAEFRSYFLTLLDTRFKVNRGDTDNLKNAVMAFSEKSGIERTTFLVTQGWYGDKYLVPSVVVDKDGVRPNSEQRIDLSHKEHASHLDFKLLSDTDFKETMLHLKTDYLNAWPRQWTFFALAHALMPLIIRPLSLKQKPALFFEGLTGAGKTQLTHIVQYFWGNFEQILNLNSSGKGVMHVGYEFKDAALIVDDYKDATPEQKRALENAIQYSYDPTAAIKLRRDSTAQTAKPTRCFFIFSGESFLTADSAKVARTILIQVDKQDTRKTRVSYERCWKMCQNYAGITPRFLHWFLNQDTAKVKGLLYETKDDLYERVAGKQNADRLSYNLALSYTVWQLWCDFMLHSEVCDFREREELVNEHWSYIMDVLKDMASRCEEEQDGLVFIRYLKQLIVSHEVSIDGLAGYMPKGKPEIGYVPDQKRYPGSVFLHPDITYNLVKQFAKNASLHGNDRSIARQLIDMKIIKETDKGRTSTQVRRNDERLRVWNVDMQELGILRATMHPVDNAFPTGEAAVLPKNADGIL